MTTDGPVEVRAHLLFVTHSGPLNKLLPEKAKVCERAFLRMHVCACVFIRSDSLIQWDKESANHNQKGNGTQSRGGGRGRCVSRIYGVDVGHGPGGLGGEVGRCPIRKNQGSPR